MKQSKLFAITIAMMLLTSACGSASQEAENKLDLLKQKAMDLDSILNSEAQRIKVLDSTISHEIMKAGKLDSGVTKEFRRLDSMINRMYRKIDQQGH